MIFSAPANKSLEGIHGAFSRLVDELNRFHPTISRLPVFADDIAAAAGQLKVGDPYVDANGFVRRRMA